ncbi:hypothetical protein RhiJN_26614 [Ceratobasidium sp. AG-Ba]|nr:hypothetical protein RhiJN_26614 [Ceratobasidium sp. AG-Ba]
MDSTGDSTLPPPYEPGAAAPNASDNPPRWASASDPPAFGADVVPGYDTTTPSKLYKVGKLSTLPLVTIADIKAHLLLLGAFEQLKQKCEEADVVDVQKNCHPSKVINARPERSGLRHEEIPPLDVLLIWHAYLLNPIQYHEDVVRMHPVLDKLPEFPLYKISSQIDLETLEMLPTEEQFHYWQRTTGDCFGLPLNTTPDADTIKIPCPSCNHTNEITWVSAPDSSGKLRGYAQHQFLVECEDPGCRFPITWEALCTKRFAEDVILCLKNSGATLAGTLMGSSGSPDTMKGRRLTELILGAFPDVKSVTELAESLRWSMNEVSKRLYDHFEPTIPGSASPRFDKSRVPSVLAAYSVPHPRSFNAVAAAHRLSIFTSNLHELEYSTPGMFDQDTQPLVLALDRFHGFLDVATRGSSKRPMVPTLDIDLVWHTMMLRPHAYREATLKFLGRVLPHDDMIEEGKASIEFAESADIWKERQKTFYSTCGCYKHPSPISSSSSSGLKFWKKSKMDAPQEPSQANYPPNSVNTDLATHPSDHSSVIVRGDRTVERLRERRSERYARDAVKVTKGKGKDRAGDAPEAEAEVAQHERAFLRHAPDSISDLDTWGLRSPVDPRAVDGKLVNHGILVIGVDVQANSTAVDMRAARSTMYGVSMGSSGW